MPLQTWTLSYDLQRLESLDAQRRTLCVAAREATGLAYAPYSQFRVGAAAWIEGKSAFVQAANLENAAYPQCICAEAALLATLHATAPGQQILAVAIAVSSPRADPAGAAPCGSCRQQLFEAEHRQGGAPIELLLVGSNDEVKVFESCGSLLPLGFLLSI